MPLSVDQFIRRLVESELFTRKELNDIVAGIDPCPQDGEELAKLLVRKKKLTVYQVQQSYAGDGRSLVLGNYAILDKIGAGGMGEVYLAEHRRMGRRAALKILPAKYADDDQAVKRFHREVQAVARLSHANIVAAFDAGESNGTHYCVMEYVEGRDLSSIVKQDGPLDIDRAIDCILQAAAGLEYAHREKVIHRDIKPSNLLLDVNGAIKVLDLGLARFEQAENDQTQTELTSTGAVMGTVDYMAPEQAMDTKNADARSDIYSLGCSLFFLLAGHAPYDGSTVVQKIFAHRDAAIPSICELRAEVPQNIDVVFRKMVAKDPGDRFQAMTEVAAALQQVQTGAMASTAAETTAGTDLELRQFLDGINQPETKTFAETPPEEPEPESPATEPTVNVPEETIAAGGSFSLGLTKRPKKTWKDYLHNRNVQIFGGGVLLFAAGLVVFAFFGPPRKTGNRPDESPRSTEQPPVRKKNYALSFDGKDDYVVIRSLNYDGTHPITFEATCRTKRNKYSTILKLGGPKELQVWIDGPGTRWCMGTMIADGGTWATKLSNDVLNVDVSTHLAAVWDGDTMSFFVDGQLQSRSGGQWRARNARYVSAIGMMLDGEGLPIGEDRFFDGVIDEIRISKVARYTKNFTPANRFEPDKNTLALYHCDQGSGNKLTDNSGNGHHGVIHGATWVKADGSPNTSRGNYALRFDGKTSYVQVPGLRLSDSSPLTFEAWVSLKSGTKGIRVVLSTFRGSRGPVLYFDRQGVVTRTRNSWNFGVPDPGSGVRKDIGIKTTDESQKTHIAGVRNGDEMTLYINGVRSASAKLTNPSTNESTGVYIGMYRMLNGRPDQVFDGIIDEVRISNAARYNGAFSPKTRFATDKNTLVLYHFDEGAGNILIDSSGNNHHGAIHGATWVNGDGSLTRKP